MTSEIEAELIDSARVLLADQATGDVVLHFKTVAGTDHYIGATFDNLEHIPLTFTRTPHA